MTRREFHKFQIFDTKRFLGNPYYPYATGYAILQVENSDGECFVLHDCMFPTKHEAEVFCKTFSNVIATFKFIDWREFENLNRSL